MRDHGGDIDAAIARWGGSDWIDLSTGINRRPYRVPELPLSAWTALPTRDATKRLGSVAATAFRTEAAILALAGAQAAIQLIPRLGQPGRARVLGPTYNEHVASLSAAGWQVDEVATHDALSGADLAVVVNPNNPDGRRASPLALLDLARSVGRLIVDESFADPRPELSLTRHAGQRGVFVLRSFGKFYGLAGVRLGFVLGHGDDIAALAEMAGPWPVSGAAIEIGCRAYADRDWASVTAQRLRADAIRLDALAQGVGWKRCGGTELFCLFDVTDAAVAQDFLARHRIWTRRFPYSSRWLRLGLPGPEAEWARLAAAFDGMGTRG